ncbi:MAG: short-chain dehydrogenase/reductase [Rhizobiaceae bacterium]
MELGLAGKKVLITGASRGIGAAAAAGFAEAGANLCLAGRDKTVLAEVAGEISGRHSVDCVLYVGDMHDFAFVEELADACSDVDVLVNNAGATPTGPIETVTADQWLEGMNLKVVATALLTRDIYRAMCSRQSGVIVNVIGNCGERPDPEIIVGTVANAGMMNFTRALGSVSPRNGVRVVGVNPGPTATDRLVSLMRRKAEDRTGDSERWKELTEPLPFGRAATPQEQADMIVFAASERASFVSGTILTVDSGVAYLGHIF